MNAVVFSAEISDFKIVYNVLKAISFKEFAILRPMEQGLKITVEEMKCVETSAYIPSSMFTRYYINPNEDIIFKISLKIFTECLHIFGDDGSPTLKLIYKGPGYPLSLLIKHSEENITIDCEIRTLGSEDFSELSLADECSLNKVVVNAVDFVDLLMSIDNAADDLDLTISPDPPYLRMKTTGAMGESAVDIYKHSDMVNIYQCKETTNAQYAFNNIRQFIKVMNYATKVSILTGESGLLGLQLSVTSNDRQMYVEYYVTALYVDD